MTGAHVIHARNVPGPHQGHGTQSKAARSIQAPMDQKKVACDKVIARGLSVTLVRNHNPQGG